ncbi:MAG TPA: glucokinase [Burkholderiales bacterium]|nr:glucokinase [Burkholderiales bacterium]
MRRMEQWQDSRNLLKTKILSLIAGDIGGTTSRLIWVARSYLQPPQILFERNYESAGFADASALLRQFMLDARRESPPDLLCLALPGPLNQRRVELTNLNWTVDADALALELRIAEVRFVNDFQAAAAGVEVLQKNDLIVLNPGLARPGATRVITGAGTGLGLAWMQADERGTYQTFASEGGHIDFAPADPQQSELLRWLRQKHEHVSWERVLSGAGLEALYAFNYERSHGHAAGFLLSASQIHAAAMQQEAVAYDTVRLFGDIYAAWTGNLALLYRPQGGLYIAGGMAIHLRSWLATENFARRAADKGRMADLVRSIPVYLITEPRLGVLGAVQIAMK